MGSREAFRRACRTVAEVHRDRREDDVRDEVDTTEAGRHYCCYRNCDPLDLRAVVVDLRRILEVLHNEDEASCGEDAVAEEGDGGVPDANNAEAVEVRMDPYFPGIRTEEVREDPTVVGDTGRHCCRCCCCCCCCCC